MKYIATLSGGKDSTVMVDMLLRNKRPLDYIVFNDTLHEFQVMYEYIDKLDKYFRERYGIGIIRLSPKKTFEDNVFGKLTKGESIGAIRGLPFPTMPCWWRRDSKVRPFEKWLKEQGLKKGNYKIYIGYTLDETHRKMQGEDYLYPLIDDFKMKEQDCTSYLVDREMENPLYRHFTRTGCYFCINQSDRAWFQVWKHYPKHWAYMQKIEAMLQALEDSGEVVLNKHWLSNKRTLAELEKQFKLKDKQGTLFDFEDEPLKDCFCKI